MNGTAAPDHEDDEYKKGKTVRCKSCRRSPKDWGKFLVFYTLFYLGIAVLTAAMYAVFNKTLDDHRPKWLVEESLIGSTPGLNIRPYSWDNMININESNSLSVEYRIRSLDEFFNEFGSFDYSNNRQLCDLAPPAEGKVCSFELKGPCSKEGGYGINSGGLCLYLRLNKIFGWIPDFYHPDDTPSNMPYSLKSLIQYQEKAGEREVAWVSCEGQNAADQENLGPLQFFPRAGFQGQYFPYTNIDGYVSPIVAVLFERPERGVVINVVCKVWARNILHDCREGKGCIRLSFLLV